MAKAKLAEGFPSAVVYNEYFLSVLVILPEFPRFPYFPIIPLFLELCRGLHFPLALLI